MVWLAFLAGIVTGVFLSTAVRFRPSNRDDPVIQERLRQYCQIR